MGKAFHLRLFPAVAWRYEFVRNSLAFRLFRAYSRLRFGSVRWIQADDGRLAVLSDDYRSYVLARCPASQQGSKRLWKRLAGFQPDLCVDVGANYGEFAVAITPFDLPTIAIEPLPAVADCLRATFSDRSRVKIAGVAVSDHEGEVEIHEGTGYSGSASVFSAVAGRPHKFWGQPRRVSISTVAVRRLDTLVAELAPEPIRSLLLKVDVEGSECDVLRGASSLLERCDWWRAIVEWNPVALTAAAIPVHQAWAEYRAWPGVVVTPDLSDHAGEALGVLPEIPPTHICDVLLGTGTLTSAPSSARPIDRARA